MTKTCSLYVKLKVYPHKLVSSLQDADNVLGIESHFEMECYNYTQNCLHIKTHSLTTTLTKF